MQEACRNDTPARHPWREVTDCLRNKFPRPQGQGTSCQERVITGISGSQTGGQGVLDVSITELVQSGGTFASNWPLNLPPAGSQSQAFLYN